MARFDFGDRLTALLKSEEMSIYDFAKAIDYDEQMTEHCVLGGFIPDDEIVKRMADVLDVPYSYLRTGKAGEDRDNLSGKLAYSLIRNYHEQWDSETKRKMIKKLTKGSKVDFIWDEKKPK